MWPRCCHIWTGLFSRCTRWASVHFRLSHFTFSPWFFLRQPLPIKTDKYVTFCTSKNIVAHIQDIVEASVKKMKPPDVKLRSTAEMADVNKCFQCNIWKSIRTDERGNASSLAGYHSSDHLHEVCGLFLERQQYELWKIWKNINAVREHWTLRNRRVNVTAVVLLRPVSHCQAAASVQSSHDSTGLILTVRRFSLSPFK